MSKHTGYVPAHLNEQLISDFIAACLREDVGSGDHTSLSTIPANAIGRAQLLVKDEGVLAGVVLAERIFKQVDPSIQLQLLKHDGDFIRHGDVVLEAEGPSRALLTAERLVLNCMQRMSGIATKTWELVQLLDGLDTKVIDTRKTTPGFRYFEKWAVRIGGGVNHRFGLYDMILIKDNHVDYAGGVKNAIEAAQRYLAEKQMSIPIEIEVRNFDELDAALACGGMQRILLDNFQPADLREAVRRINKRYETEASGGITEKTIRAYAMAGVDFISVGALTHSVRSLDLSFKAKMI